MTPEDLARFSSVTDPQLHPDGTLAAFVVTKANIDDDRYESQIWLWDGQSCRQWTSGRRDSRPRWSPDGTQLLFLRSASVAHKSAQIAIMATAGGEAQMLTEFALGVSEAEWSPNGSTLGLVATTWHDEWDGLDDAEHSRKPRRITEPYWRSDGGGFLHDRITRAYVMPASGGDAEPLTLPTWRPSGLVFSPDGSSIAVLAEGHAEAGFDGGNQVWEINVGGGEPTALVGVGDWGSVAYRPDGVVYAAGVADLDARPTNTNLYRLDGGQPILLAPGLDRDIVVPAGGPQWVGDGPCRVMAEDRGRQIIIEIAADGSHHEVPSDHPYVTGISVSADGSTTIATTTSPTNPGEVVLLTADGSATLSSINTAFAADAALSDAHHFVTTHDGVELDVWVYLPSGDGPFPVLFNIHGGPAAQYGFGFFDEFQVEVGHGYAVVATNPRGASGHGHDFVRGALHTWAMPQPPDALDLLHALDAALERFDALDNSRLGIMGGSYGGLITAKILSFDRRFESAVPERGVYNWVSFVGASDIGLWFDELYIGQRDYTDWSQLWEASTLRTAHLIETPCLVIHSDSDHRCPIDQGEQFFATLLDNGVTAEFLRFPGEGHELSRSGSPKHRVERFDAILDWHDRYLRA